MNHDIRNTCGKRRGCSVLIVLPHDSQLKFIRSRMYGIRDDSSKVLSMADPQRPHRLAGPAEQGPQTAAAGDRGRRHHAHAVDGVPRGLRQRRHVRRRQAPAKADGALTPAWAKTFSCCWRVCRSARVAQPTSSRCIKSVN